MWASPKLRKRPCQNNNLPQMRSHSDSWNCWQKYVGGYRLLYDSGCRPGFPSFKEEGPQQWQAQERTLPSGPTRTKFRAQLLPRTAVSLQQMITGSLHPAVTASFYLSLENQFNLNPVSIHCFMVSCFDPFWNEKASCHKLCFDLKSIFEMSMVIWRGVCGRNKWCLLPLVGG